MKFSNRIYDILKYLAMFFLPALAILVKTVFAIWGLPYGEEISATIVAINAFLGACLGISSISYQKDQLKKKDNWDSL
jgi:ABC-type transport system involved in multi-copper enzyme maturation permease subunit